MLLSIILPSYKASSALKNQLPDFIQFLESKKIEYEIIVVDDGSDDDEKTKEVALSLNCTFLTNGKNMGKGAAVRNGMLHAKGKFRIFTDADIPFEYDAMEEFLHYLKNKEFDLVIGDRTLPESNYFDNISKSRKMGSAVFSFIVGRFITTGMFDTQCGIKGFSAKVADDIFSVSKINSFAFDVEVIYIALKRNYDIKRLPVKLRNSEDSSVSLLKHSIGMVVDIMKIKWNHLRGKYIKK